MIVIGLTGGIGSGKSTVAKYIKSKKIPVFDSDLEVNKLYTNKDKDLLKIISEIYRGKNFIKTKKINKTKLGEIIFNDIKKLKKVEKIIFKKLNIKRKHFLIKNRKLKKKIVVLDTPLLFENNINKLCNYVILVKMPLKKRLFRILKRPGMTRAKAKKIIARQMPEKNKTKLADFVVQTSLGKWYSFKKVDRVLKKIVMEKK